jgi:tetratricopeptide (TPR) repeat protein
VRIDPFAIAAALRSLSTSNALYYLHPSFEYVFEVFYPERNGLVSELKRFDTNTIYTPRLTAQQLKVNEDFWKAQEGFIGRVESLAPKKLSDSAYVAGHLSRAVNSFGVDLQKANKLAEAGKNFDLAADLNTNNLPAIMNLEFNQTLSGKKPRDSKQRSSQDMFGQYRSWEQILSENGPFDVPEYLFAEGNQFLQQYLVRQACDQFKRCSELTPTNATPKLSLASALIRGQWLDEAHRVVTELEAATNITTRAQKLDLISMEAAIYFGRHETNRAVEKLSAAMEQYPKELTFYESLGELYRTSGQWDKALELLNREVSMMPTNVALRMQRADVALNAGETNAVMADLDAVLKIDPANTDAALFQVFMAIQRKDYAKGLKLADAILDRNDRNAQALIYKGIIHMETKDDEKAIDDFTKALKIEPDSVAAIRNRAIVNLRAGHLKAAKEDYEVLQRAYPKSHQVYYGLAEVAAKQKDTAEAIKDYELYLKYAPTNVVGEAAEERKAVEAKYKELKGGK